MEKNEYFDLLESLSSISPQSIWQLFQMYKLEVDSRGKSFLVSCNETLTTSLDLPYRLYEHEFTWFLNGLVGRNGDRPAVVSPNRIEYWKNNCLTKIMNSDGIITTFRTDVNGIQTSKIDKPDSTNKEQFDAAMKKELGRISKGLEDLKNSEVIFEPTQDALTGTVQN